MASHKGKHDRPEHGQVRPQPHDTRKVRPNRPGRQAGTATQRKEQSGEGTAGEAAGRNDRIVQSHFPGSLSMDPGEGAVRLLANHEDSYEIGCVDLVRISVSSECNMS